MKLLLIVVLISFTYADGGIEDRWTQWKLDNNKLFLSPKKENDRKTNFVKNCEEIDAHNELFAKGEVLYEKGVNFASDLTEKQFLDRYTGIHKEDDDDDDVPAGRSTMPINLKETLPETVDWRTSGGVSSPKSQGSCGSCWTFSTCSTIEFMHWKKTKELLDCAEQQLVDCFNLPGDRSGCTGGWMSAALQYVNRVGGIAEEKNYPYKAQFITGACYDDKVEKPMKLNSVEPVGYLTLDEPTVKAAIAQIGVMTTCVDVTGWFHYKSGILSNSTYYSVRGAESVHCPHAVGLVGYSVENGVPYYIIKNSWGSGWAEGGYARLDARYAAHYTNRNGVRTETTNGGLVYYGIWYANMV